MWGPSHPTPAAGFSWTVVGIETFRAAHRQVASLLPKASACFAEHAVPKSLPTNDTPMHVRWSLHVQALFPTAQLNEAACALICLSKANLNGFTHDHMQAVMSGYSLQL